MKKGILVLYLVLSAALLVALMVTPMFSGVHAYWVGYPGPDTLSDCDHFGDYNETNDTFTAIGVAGYYGYEPPAYVHGNWIFCSGYGGDYPASGPMTCQWYMAPNWDVHYDYSSFSWEYRNNAWAWYRDWSVWDYELPRVAALSGVTAAYFYDPQDPQDTWWVSSAVSMTADYP